MCGRLTREQGADLESSARNKLTAFDIDHVRFELTWNAAPGHSLRRSSRTRRGPWVA